MSSISFKKIRVNFNKTYKGVITNYTLNKDQTRLLVFVNIDTIDEDTNFLYSIQISNYAPSAFSRFCSKMEIMDNHNNCDLDDLVGTYVDVSLTETADGSIFIRTIELDDDSEELEDDSEELEEEFDEEEVED